MRVRVGIPLATAAAVLSVASTAWACTYFAGQTWFDDPATAGLDQKLETEASKNAEAPEITVWGNGVDASENYPEAPWRVVASLENQCCGSGTNAITPPDPDPGYTFTQDPSPGVAQLGPTDDATVDNMSTGTFSVCWLYGDETGKALNPASLTVIR